MPGGQELAYVAAVVHVIHATSSLSAVGVLLYPSPAALPRARASARPAETVGTARDHCSDGSPWEALSAAVAVLTARRMRLAIDEAALTEGVADSAVIKALVIIAAAMLAAAFPATGEALLQDLGTEAASQHPRNGDTP